jgi:hypothetical protein
MVNGSGGAACAAGAVKASSAPAAMNVPTSFLIMDLPPKSRPILLARVDHSPPA